MTITTHITLRISPELHERLEAYAERHGVRSAALGGRQIWELLFWLREQEVAAASFTVPELSLIAEAVGRSEDDTAPLMADVRRLVEDDSPFQGGPELWERKHDLPAGGVGVVLAKLDRLGPASHFFLRDALLEWWQRKLPPNADGFRAVGFEVGNA